MLVTMKEILDRASKEGYAVAAPNVGHELDARAAIEVAEELNSPLILDVGYKANPDIVFYGHMLGDLCRQSTVPICINLDHGPSYEACVHAIQAGFTSVMIDRSSESYEKNVADSSEVVKLAHAVGVTVEAELGHVGQAGNYAEDGYSALTTPEEAVEFVKATGVDCLAVAIGTAHGAYPKGEKPFIRHENLAAIKEALGQDFPLVLHGSSGTDEEDLKKVCANGINKVNIANDLCQAVTIALNDAHLEGQASYGVWGTAKEAFKAKLAHMMTDVYCSAGKAWEVKPAGMPGVGDKSMEEK